MKKLKVLSIILVFALFIVLSFCNNVQALEEWQKGWAYISADEYMSGSDYDLDQDTYEVYLVKQSAKLSLKGDIENYDSDNKEVATVDPKTGEITIHSVGTCTIKNPTNNDTQKVLKVLSDADYKKREEIVKTLTGAKIVGEQAKTRFRSDDVWGRMCQILVGRNSEDSRQ